MARAIELKVSVAILEDVTGIWCNHCARSSGRKTVLAMTVGQRLSIQECSRCVDCGGRV
jgi:hypothetical protein